MSVELMTIAYGKFSKAASLVVNPRKCRLYCAGLDEEIGKDMLAASGFLEGQMSFKYLGVLVIRMLQKIESICRNFLWTGGYEGSQKVPIAWKQMWRPRGYGGLNIIDIEVWNKVSLMKLMWNLHGKEDSLWVKWVQAYYLKHNNLMEVQAKANDS
ncbi:uncharacterized protein LOC131651348 [Vicia villosa]|uniref:uncharacterized protein LOC131651348 n=1 Tax=Vicia villosa TaxID=3911 RepID=UPI00273B5EA6|nr:uncharacterized protein LOC131651348 [Vicia villosa]